MQSLNINLLLLTSKYDRLNRSLNRVWIQRSERFLEHKKLNDVKSLLEGASSISKTEIFDGIRNTTNRNLYTYNTIIPYLNSLKNFKGQHTLYNKVHDTNNTTILKLFMKLENNENNANDTNLRIERATEKENRVKRNRDNINDGDDELNVWKESRSGRSRREERRGKKRGKNKRRPKRSHRRLGIYYYLVSMRFYYIESDLYLENFNFYLFF